MSERNPLPGCLSHLARFRMSSELLWISEETDLPKIGQDVLLATPRQSGEFWDITTATLLARHEGIVATPVRRGDLWPTNYYWSRGRSVHDNSLVTGNAWWASMQGFCLPPGAEHASSAGYDFVRQIGEVFVPQGKIKS